MAFLTLEQRRRLAAERAAAPQMAPEEAKSLLASLAQRTGQTLDNVAYVLDTPGAVIRSAIAGEGDPFGSWDDRVSGQELLENAGLLQPADTTLGKVGNTVAGIGAEILLDPLSLFSGPTKAYTAAGRAASKAGLMDDAARVVSNKMLAGGTPLNDTAKFTVNAIAKAGGAMDAKTGLPTASAVAARPLVGPRVAARKTNLQELIAAAGDDALDPAAKAAIQQSKRADVDVALRQMGLNYDDVKEMTLAKTLGVGLPLGETSIAFDLLGKQGGDKLADVMDLTGQAIGWSTAGRLAGAAFQQKTNGTWNTADQMQAIRTNQLKTAAAREADSLNAKLVVKARGIKIPQAVQATTGVKEVFSGEGNDALVRMMELDPSEWKKGVDDVLYNSVPEIRNIVDQWKGAAGSPGVRDTMLADSKKWGLHSSALDHPYGVSYLPQQQTELTLLDGGKGTRGLDYSTMTPDQLKRADAFKVPGGRTTLRELSINPKIAGLGRQGTDRDAADEIKRLIFQKHGIDFADEHALALARSLRNIPDETVKAGTSIFGQHPIEDIARYRLDRSKAMGTARSKIDAIADLAVKGLPEDVAGGGHVSAIDSLSAVKLQTIRDPQTNDIVDGAGARLREAIAKRLNVSPDQVDLAKYAVPKTLVDRLNRTMDIYQSPELQTQVGQLWNSVTRWWKAGVLTWPSRYTRDLYSGVVQNWIETGDLAGVIRSSKSAYDLLKGNTQAFGEAAAQLPKYQGLTPDEALRQFLEDAGAVRIFGGTAVEDLATATRTGQTAQELIPGFNPQSPTSILREEFASKPGRTWSEYLGNYAKVKNAGITSQPLDTKNPLFRVGERMGDFTDGINRLTGYLTLLGQGVSPAEAAKRIAAAQVDYGSLTTIERGLIRDVLFPFWAYTSRMGHYVVNQILARPGGRYGQLVRGVHDIQSDDDVYTPNYIREQVGYPIQTGPDGTTFLTDIDFPGFDQINMIKPGAGVFDAGRTAESVFQMANPLIRSAAELGTGQNFFFKQPLGTPGTESGWDRLSMAMGGDRLPVPVNMALSIAPLTGRVGSTLNTLLDEDRTLGERIMDTLVNNTTGVKRRKVSPQAEAYDAASKIEQSLKGRSRNFQSMYVPEDELTRLAPGQQREYALYKMLQKHLKEVNKAKKEGQPLPASPF